MQNVAKVILLFIGLSGVTQAATIGFDADNNLVNLNSIFTVDIVGGDLFPETQGGGVNLFYDESIINVLSVSIDGAVWNFVNDLGAINNLTGDVGDILVSAFNGSGSDPTGSFIVASIEFQAVGFGMSALSLAESTVNPWASDGAAVAPTFLAGSITVSEVPIPGALWLFISGFVVLVRFRQPARQAVL